jgi:hypothetical protein
MIDFEALKTQYQQNPARTTKWLVGLAVVFLIITLFGYGYLTGDRESNPVVGQEIASERIFRIQGTDTTQTSPVGAARRDIVTNRPSPRSTSPSMLTVLVLLFFLGGSAYLLMRYLRKSVRYRTGGPLAWGSAHSVAERIHQQSLGFSLGRHQEMQAFRIGAEVVIVLSSQGVSNVVLKTMTMEEWTRLSEPEP